ncbi:MAG: hypothetical protein MJZ24_03215 [Paludibacteraceae bacterium]|nr:hypothetical protein [Paludibacteraceae bacterium]
MQSTSLSFPHSARTTYAAVKNLFQKQDKFSSVEYDDILFVVEARHGAWISPFSENIKVKVVATGCDACKVVVSSSRSVLNLLNFGANSENVSDLGDYISNEVYRLRNVDDLVRKDDNDHSTIRFKTPDIRFK